MSFRDFPWQRHRSKRLQARTMSAAPSQPGPSPPTAAVSSSPSSTTRPPLTDGVIRAYRGVYVTKNGKTRFYGPHSRPSLDHELPGSDDDNSEGDYEIDPEDSHSITWSECTTWFRWCLDNDDDIIDDPQNYHLFHQKDIFDFSRTIEDEILASVNVVEALFIKKVDPLVAAATSGGFSHELESARDEMYAVLTEHRMAIAFAFAEHRKFM